MSRVSRSAFLFTLRQGSVYYRQDHALTSPEPHYFIVLSRDIGRLSDAAKYGMLDRLERKIAEELLSRFADAEEYGGTMDAYTVLLAPDRCEGLYTAYLCAQMDFINGEIARYNNDMEIFSAEWDAYAAYLYRTRTHKKSPSFTAL